MDDQRRDGSPAPNPARSPHHMPAPERSPSRAEPANDNAPSSGGVSRTEQQNEREFAPLPEVRPETLTPVGVEDDEVPRRSGDNRSPGIIDDLKEIFPWLPGARVYSILAPIDGVLDLTGPAEAANAAATRVMRDHLIAQIKSRRK
jgi:hypothetical protein